jgi:hypothetical protein
VEGIEMNIIYGVSLSFNEPEINQHCFGDCGKILIGGIELDGLPFLPCNQESCPFEDKCTPVLGKTHDGSDFAIRKLQSPPAEAK